MTITFYLTLDHAHDLVIARDIARDLDYDHDRAHTLDFAHARDLAYALDLAHAVELARDLARALELKPDRDLDPELQRKLQTLRNQPLPPSQNAAQLKQWWKTQKQVLIKKLRAAMIEYRNLGHDWKFSPEQINKLNQYYTTTLLLVGCLKRACLPIEARQRIEQGILFPMG